MSGWIILYHKKKTGKIGSWASGLEAMLDTD